MQAISLTLSVVEVGYNMGKLDDLQELWTTDKDKYYLVLLDDNSFGIVDKNNMALLIEEDELYILVIEKMISNGVKVVKAESNTKKFIEVSSQIAMEKYELFKNSLSI